MKVECQKNFREEGQKDKQKILGKEIIFNMKYKKAVKAFFSIEQEYRNQNKNG